MRLRPALCAVALLAACSGSGGGGGNITVAPIAQWGTFRHDASNSGFGSGLIDKNRGELRFAPVDLGDEPSDFHAPPAIGFHNQIYIGTSRGLLALDDNGIEEWRFQFCNLVDGSTPCTAASETCVEVGAVASTPAVTSGEDIVVVSTSGVAFVVHDDGNNFTCEEILAGTTGRPFSSRASGQTIIDARDRSIRTVVVGTGDAGIEVLNDDGSTRFRFSTGTAELTSTPAIGSTNFYFTSPDGFLYAIDFAGRLRWRTSVGADFAGPLLPSPSSGSAVYAVTTNPGLLATNPDGSLKWRYTQETAIPGSPALVLQQVKIADQNNPGTTVKVFEQVIYVVDEAGTLYGVRDRDGSILVNDSCSTTTDRGCVNDADCPSGETCQKRFCSATTTTECASDKDCPLGEKCGQSGEGFPAVVDLAPQAHISSSPAVTSDLFAVIGTDDGRLCARSLENKFPGEDKTPETPSTTPDSDVWVNGNGCIDVTGGAPIVSPPVLDQNGRIYFVAGGALYAIE